MEMFRRSPAAGLVSLRYFILRFSTAGGALVAGLVQTFVFARVLEPTQFSLFLLVGALGITMWLFDLGISKILFVQMRQKFLAGESTAAPAEQANAVAIFYGILVALGGLVCFAIMALRPSASMLDATLFGLFFFYSAFNLTWFVLRNVSVAVDEYLFFETVEAARRVGYIALMLAMLVGLPFTAFIILINLSWALVLTLAGVKLVRKGALSPKLRGVIGRLRLFLREHWRSALRTGTHAAGEVYIHNVLYIAVPAFLGLGAPTIIADTAMKIFFGTLNLCSAACDLLVPRQTAAFSQRDPRTLLRATLAAFVLCMLPVLGVTGLLLFGARDLFAFLLGPSATMPAAATPIIILLLATAAAKSAPNFLLQHTGYFREIARLSIINVVTMTAAIGAGVYVGVGIVGLLSIYAGVFCVVAVLYIVLALRKPLHDVHGPAQPVNAQPAAS